MNTTRTVLLLGNFRPTVTVIRAVSRLGYNTAVKRDLGGLAAASKHCDEIWESETKPEDPAFLEELRAFLEGRPDISIVMPVEEQYVLALARNWDSLPAGRTYATPSPRIVLTCLDKVGMLDVCKKTGIPSAPNATVANLEELYAAAEQIGYPLVVRPLWSARPIAGRKAYITMDEKTMKRELHEWPEGHESLIVQRFISGPRYNVDYAAQKGKTIQAVATRILRTDSYDYTGIDVYGETIPMPDNLWDFTERMNAELNYTGVGLIQFMVDHERDEISFLELNPRFNGNSAVPAHAGLELVRLSIDLAEDPDCEEPVVISPGGLKHAWLYGDVMGTRKSLQRGMLSKGQVPGEIRRAITNALTADFHVIWSWRDPMPAISQMGIAMNKLLGRIE
ncbi:ATP-grasp domain-containing protein [Aliiruegeria lutimaris]|uniref:ATP-grasp domain-containing protein n=1 Tax=Aliiruegeria lutimaris TaxID=571298 RepID=A0A1G9PW87_9RHOB|nr:ATP-grasp domain-containing protein [Aliiruegeria lutimaris]SDM03020.1 ATP-grasp domain-containing protein [Aliiruegeria lutimaris]